MSRQPQPINLINDSKETWKVAVRIVNIWILNRSPKPTIEMILMDKEGHKIIAQVKNVDYEKWHDELKEGSCYIMENFEVDANRGQYRATNHGWKLTFVKATRVTPQDMPGIPNHVYNFTAFDDILNGIASPDYLIDVIGEVAEILQWDLDNKLKKVVFILKDKVGTTVTCTLWETFAQRLKSYLDSHEIGPVVMLLHLAKIKEPKGKYGLTIQNSMYGSKLLINENISEINDFKNSLDLGQSSVVCYSEKLTQMSQSSALSVEDRFCYNADIVNLSELAEMKKECMCVTVGTITKVLVANGWSYECCPTCNKAIKAVETTYTCKGCGAENTTTITRFRLQVKVTYEKESAIFTLWDRECNQLIKKSADEIKREMIAEEGNFYPNSIPMAVDNVLEQTVAFRMKFDPLKQSLSVSQISTDKDIISSTLKKLKMNEAVSKPEKNQTSSSQMKAEDIVDSQTFFATAEYDPNLLESITPAKRLVSSDSQVEYGLDDLGSFQQSSSKLSKHIKIE